MPIYGMETVHMARRRCR